MNETDILAAAALIILGLVAVYLRFGPKRIIERMKFELIAALGLVTGTLLIAWNVHSGMKGTVDSALWEVVAWLQCFAFATFYILVAFFVRWLVYSKRSNKKTAQDIMRR